MGVDGVSIVAQLVLLLGRPATRRPAACWDIQKDLICANVL